MSVFIEKNQVLKIINSLPILHNTTEGGRMFHAWESAIKQIENLPCVDVTEGSKDECLSR